MAVKLNVGSGDMKLKGYTSVDLYDENADIKADILDLPFPNQSVDEILAYQVIEHIPYDKTMDMFKELYRVLKPGGTLITECPDLEVVAQKILEEGLTDQWVHNIYGQYSRPEWGGHRKNHGLEHLTGFTFDRLKKIADELGFEITKQDMEDKSNAYKCEETLSCKWVK